MIKIFQWHFDASNGNMCACKIKKSFFIEDILKDHTKTKEIINIKKCFKPNGRETTQIQNNDSSKQKIHTDFEQMNVPKSPCHEGSQTTRVLEQRRNTYPLCPMPMKPGVSWSYKSPYDLSPVRQYAYYRESLPEQLLRSQLANMRFASHHAPFHSLDRVGGSIGWWNGGAGKGLWGGRRKGGQVRFSAAQTGALERRFATAKYLSPDERRALANSLRLSDRQVKTWYQNRRAKWRRATPDAEDSSPAESSQASDLDDTSLQETPQVLQRPCTIVTSH